MGYVPLVIVLGMLKLINCPLTGSPAVYKVIGHLYSIWIQILVDEMRLSIRIEKDDLHSRSTIRFVYAHALQAVCFTGKGTTDPQLPHMPF